MTPRCGYRRRNNGKGHETKRIRTRRAHRRGGFRIYPNESQIDGLRKDYTEMGKMIFDKRAPSFDEILCVLAEIEGKINGGNR